MDKIEFYNEGVRTGIETLIKNINEHSDVTIDFESIEFALEGDTIGFNLVGLEVSYPGADAAYFESGLEHGMKWLLDVIHEHSKVRIDYDELEFQVAKDAKSFKVLPDKLTISHPGYKGLANHPKRSTSVQKVERDGRTGLIKQTIEETEYHDE